jgi:hypothetical protein
MKSKISDKERLLHILDSIDSIIDFTQEYAFKTIKSNLMFGYEIKPFNNSMALQMADPEKALLDLLYLYPQYNTLRDMEDLRLDEDYLHDGLKPDLLKEYTLRFESKVLEQRVSRLLTNYNL